MAKTRLSSKGQIILPKSIRESNAWESGMEFTVEPSGNGVVLRPAALFQPTRLDDVAGCLRTRSNPISSAVIRQAVDKEVKKRHDRGRY